MSHLRKRSVRTIRDPKTGKRYPIIAGGSATTVPPGATRDEVDLDEPSYSETRHLMERRARAWSRYQGVLDDAREEGRSLTAEERQTLDRLEEEISELSGDVDRYERAQEIERRLNRVDRSRLPAGGGAGTPEGGDEGRSEEYREAWVTAMRYGPGQLTAEERQVLAEGRAEVPGERRAQSIGTGSAGGFLVPDQTADRIIEVMATFEGVVEAGATVLTTGNGQTIPYPTNDDTANEGSLLGENTVAGETDLVFGSEDLEAFIFTSDMVKSSLALVEDQEFDLEDYLVRKLGERIGRAVNTYTTTGTGTSQPEGITVGATTGKTTASGSAITYDEIIDLEHSVDPAYRDPARARFMWHDTTMAALRKLEDADGRKLWQPSLIPGNPDTFDGYRYVVNNKMPEIALSASVITFGDHREAYIVRRVRGITTLTLRERFADALQVAWLAYQRNDGRVVNAQAVKTLDMAAA